MDVRGGLFAMDPGLRRGKRLPWKGAAPFVLGEQDPGAFRVLEIRVEDIAADENLSAERGDLERNSGSEHNCREFSYTAVGGSARLRLK